MTELTVNLVNQVPTFDMKPYKVKCGRAQLSLQKGMCMRQYNFPCTYLQFPYLKKIKSGEFLESRTCVSALVGKLLVRQAGRIQRSGRWVRAVQTPSAVWTFFLTQ